MKGWIAVDLDGTLAFYDHWRRAERQGRYPAMTDKGPMELLYAGKPAGMAKPRPDGLWDCIDRHGKVRGLPFPNRARAMDALVAIAQRAEYGGSIKLRHVAP